jgi:hypothetical protein
VQDLVTFFDLRIGLLAAAGTMLSNTFVQNLGTNGGAVWQNNLKSVNHTLNLFMGNSAPKGSGGIELNQVESMSVTTCNFTLGTGSKGGAIYTQVCPPPLPFLDYGRDRTEFGWFLHQRLSLGKV